MARPSMWATTCLFLAVISASVTPADTEAATKGERHPCFSECHCSTRDSVSTAQCTSVDFIRKLSSKDVTALTSLDLSAASIHVLNKKLRKLTNLEKLDLSQNRLTEIKHFPRLPKLKHLNLRSNTLKSLSAKQLPASLEFLDLSNNFIKELPVDLTRMQNLKRLYVGGNPFTCSRESLDTRDLLLERNIEIVGQALCHSPAKLRGQSWLHAVDFDEFFKLHGQGSMQADIADRREGSGEASSSVNMVDEGSGDSAEVTVNVFQTEASSTTSAPELHEHNSENSLTEDDFTFAEEEGSGVREFVTVTTPDFDETSDNIKYDHEEEREDEDEGSGVVEDNYHLVDDEISTPEPVKEGNITQVLLGVLEAPKPAAEVEVTTEDSGPDMSIASVSSHPIHTNEILGNVVEANKSDTYSLGTNIFLFLVIAALVILVVYGVKKNKERKRRRYRQKAMDLENQKAGIEMLPKASVPSEKHNGNPEAAPLMNGQNGTNNDNQEKDIEPNKASGLTQSPVERRKKDELDDTDSIDGSQYLSVPSFPPSPDVVSVKVKASEIPDSVPRTPILVDRRKTSDGQHIVVTPDLNQRSSTGF